MVPLPRPARARGAYACWLARPLQRALTPLVQTYGTVPYADIDPTWLAWASYVLMFGMMFGDAGQGVLLVGVAVALRAGWPRWAAPVPPGLAVRRRCRPGRDLLRPALRGVLRADRAGAGDLARIRSAIRSPCCWSRSASVRSCSPGRTRSARSTGGGKAAGRPRCTRHRASRDSSCFLGAGLAVGGWYFHQRLLLAAGGAAAVAGLALALAGFLADSGRRRHRRWSQASVELVDMVVRLGSNVVSFTRLAAFGLTHAALGLLVWEGTRALWHRGGVLAAAAVVVFAAGTALAFSLEALVAAIQALRLEYYELFSRVFVTQGRPFRPWHVPTVTGHEPWRSAKGS